VFVVAGGKHCSETYLSQQVNPGVKAAQEEEIAIIKKWVAEFYDRRKILIHDVAKSTRELQCPAPL
jgi:hypothetical protein